ncbi:hypothetical protein [Arthrobacter sp. H35-D1]|uniref:hypothetical protein n=1 Tax=Arthrobacter sp. H35-D1 TaxID=3046202 RepID=UPI0024BB8528|nr:hypothetical protein [Arthrobacter sp. H35-D1]MDJ0313520.1 hypothetical protein [Arthrobacter sp. H35-D1]
MGVKGIVARLATGRIHVFILEIPGHLMLRMQVEASIAARGWVLAEAPADADVLLIVGEAPDAFIEIADGVWNQIPSPRHRTSVAAVAAISETLDAVPAVLRDEQQQSRDARQRPQHVIGGSAESEHSDGSDSSGDGHGDGAMDMEGMDMGMDMDMSGPAGIPLASGDESDRDGLEMDIIHLTLGPVLPDWPAGLVVHCTLHGDVIGDAAMEFLPGTGTNKSLDAIPAGLPAGPTTRAAMLCDAAGYLLAVAGWETVALKVRRIRDGLITGNAPEQMAVRLSRVYRQLERSRTLRWSLAGIPKAVDIGARTVLLGWLESAAAHLAEGELEPDGSVWPASLEDVRTALLGQELSVARLIVACVEPSRIAELSGAVHG